MVDYYALPQGKPDGWPGRRAAGSSAFERKARTVEEALLQDVGKAMGGSFDASRFVPYVMMHEFEAMLFSDCDGFARGIGCIVLAPKFQEIRDAFGTPEEIDDSPDTAPSKRVPGARSGIAETADGNPGSRLRLDSRRFVPHVRIFENGWTAWSVF